MSDELDVSGFTPAERAAVEMIQVMLLSASLQADYLTAALAAAAKRDWPATEALIRRASATVVAGFVAVPRGAPASPPTERN